MFKFGKYICILSLVAALFVFKPNAALAGGGFTASCHNIIAEGRIDTTGDHPVPSPDYVLTANCNAVDGHDKRTFVDLNEHILNNFGQLAWLKNGGFRQSARNCGINVSNVTVLHCEVADGRGNWPYASIVLDDEIANYDGNLTVLDGF